MSPRGDWCQTYSGIKFFPLDPKPEEIKIEDIAHALSMLCRFTGHCMSFYSVAEHCCHICDAAPEDHKLEALLHDGSEAYLADISRPVKRYLKDYVKIEENITKVINEKFGLKDSSYEIVKDLDNRILHDESSQIMNISDKWNIPGKPLGVKLKLFSPNVAEEEFMLRFNQYRKGQK